MHHCLRIAEILTMVMDFLVAAGHRGAREVLALLKTCKSFYEPALDLLWRDLHILAPLVMCLPEDVWKIRNKLLVRLSSANALDRNIEWDAVPDWNIKSRAIVAIHVSRTARQQYRTRRPAIWHSRQIYVTFAS